MDTTNARDAEPPANPPNPGPALETTATTPPTSGSELATTARRRPMPRKGHTKSRRGCFNCKRRKVKCQETRPECFHCTRIGLVCEYPDTHARSALSMVSAPAAPLQSTPTMFTPADMRFFHHFLVTAYPPLPIMRGDIWREIAALSHSYDYLMHAMLGLGASHLGVYGGNYSSDALSHRVTAIQYLNQALSTPPKSTAEADARFAAIMALAFQSSCMPDGMNEFLSMIKGCHVIATSSLLACKDSLFAEFTQEGYGQSVRRAIGTAPLFLNRSEQILLDEFLVSLRALAPLCRSPLEVLFLASTERVVKVARKSAAEAFMEFAQHYSLMNHATQEDFTSFIDPGNHSAQILLIHFTLIEFSIGYLALGPAGSRFAYRERSCIAWMNRLADSLPDEYMKYVEWPMNRQTSLPNALLEHPELTRLAQHDKQRYDGSVEVFPVCAAAFRDLRQSKKPMTVFPSKLYTGVTRLRQWLGEVVLADREKHLDAMLRRLRRLHDGIRNWSDDNSRGMIRS
ncbi:hypothetical protein N0V88_000834 [Collariella sp. IMI 366227]|nr:hypothetical protein N0V88_000834 [Collariella sp. IMI 366227]